jgi:uncharacterized protein YneF (UPF0154 family)
MKTREEIVREISEDWNVRKLIFLRAPFEIGLILFYLLALYYTKNIFLFLLGLDALGYYLITRKMKKEIEKRWNKIEEEEMNEYYNTIIKNLKTEKATKEDIKRAKEAKMELKKGKSVKLKGQGLYFCSIPFLEMLVLAVITALLAIVVGNYFHEKYSHTDCFIWYGVNDNRTKEVDCSLITEDFCESMNCTFKKWNCGTPVCICG